MANASALKTDALMQYMNKSLILSLLCLLLPQITWAQDTERVTLTPDQLPTIKTWKDPKQHALELQKHVLRVRVTPKKDPYITTLGDPSLYGIVTMIQDEKTEDPALITGEFFVRDAQKIEILLPELGWQTATIARADRNLGLAQLTLADPIPEQIRPKAANVRNTPLVTWDTLHTLTFDLKGLPLVRPVTLQGPGAEGMAFYMGASPGLGEGHPIFDDRGMCLGLYAIRAIEKPGLGYALMSQALLDFLKAEPTQTTQDDLRIEVLGGAKKDLTP